MGTLSGTLSLLFLRTLQIVRRETRQVIELILQFVGVPGLWLSVPFVSKALTDVRPSQLLTSYIITLAVVWTAIILLPLFRLILTTATEIGSEDEE
jgi:hypothetical protein